MDIVRRKLILVIVGLKGLRLVSGPMEYVGAAVVGGGGALLTA